MDKRTVSNMGKELDLIDARTPVSVGRDRVTGEKVYIYLDLEDTAVLERAEAVYKSLNAVMDDIRKPPDNTTEEEAMTFVAEVIRKANSCAKEAIDQVFDEPIAEKIWGNSSCISFGDSVDESRFGRVMSALLDLYKPAIEKMANEIKAQSDAFASEVLNEGDGQV